jgi:hypothetical protein
LEAPRAFRLPSFSADPGDTAGIKSCSWRELFEDKGWLTERPV